MARRRESPVKHSVIPAQSAPELPEELALAFTSPESSTIQGADYDPDTETLRVTFRHEGMVYRYMGVSPLIWREFSEAKSRGKFFQERIRPLFMGVRIA